MKSRAVRSQRSIFTTGCLLVLVAFTANADTLRDQTSRVDVVFKDASKEAIYLGAILDEVAEILADDDDLKAASDEYFIRDLWAKATEALKNATQKATSSVQDAFTEAKGHIQRVAAEAQQKLKEKAAEIMSKILTRIAGQYAIEDSISRMDIMQILRDLIKGAAQRLFGVGKALGQLKH
ncbi:hypothetical protein MRX96_021287 [Rhipicephalus microplus]